MRIRTIFFAGATMLAMAHAVQAAAPKVSGKYAYISTALCQALITTNKDAQGDVVSVNAANGGTISLEVGYIQFPNTAASSGNVSITGNGLEAAAVRVNGSPFAVKPQTNNLQGQFSLTETTFTLTVGEKNMVFAMSFGNVAAGTAKTINLVQKENAGCINSVIATKQ